MYTYDAPPDRISSVPALERVEPSTRIEPVTSSLPKESLRLNLWILESTAVSPRLIFAPPFERHLRDICTGTEQCALKLSRNSIYDALTNKGDGDGSNIYS